MLFRASVSLIISFFLIASWEIYSLRQRKEKELPLRLGMFLILMALLLRISSFYLGFLLAIHFFTDKSSLQPVLCLSFAIASMWFFSILLQITQNEIRSFFGKPKRKIQWIRSSTIRKKWSSYFVCWQYGSFNRFGQAPHSILCWAFAYPCLLQNTCLRILHCQIYRRAPVRK